MNMKSLQINLKLQMEIFPSSSFSHFYLFILSLLKEEGNMNANNS